MENVFEELVAESTTATETVEETEEVSTSPFDLTSDDLADPEEETSIEEPVNEVEEVAPVQSNPTNAAFAQMRTQNREYQNKLTELDNIAKSLGMSNADEFIAKAKSAQIQKAAQAKGIPVEVEQELAEMRALKESIEAERIESARIDKEKSFVSNVNAFVKDNNLTKASVDKLSQDLENDGFSMDALMAMPEAALKKVLSSYVGTNYQKNLERKDTIRKELPVNQTSKIDTASLNKELDALAKQLAGKF